MDIEKLSTTLRELQAKANKMKKNDLPHLEAELREMKTELADLEINIKYLKDFLNLYKALKDRGVITK